MGEQLGENTRFLRFYPFLIVLPYIANSGGWLLTEVGRSPWIVFGLMKIEEGVSIAVSAGKVLTTLIVFTLVYGALMVADVYLLAKYARWGSGRVVSDEVEESAGISLISK
jgi:cytochrome d ubiquinol oxidase subunit I